MFRRKRSAEDFAEEIKAHLELEADALKGEGLSEDEARWKARREFGNVRAAQERFYLKGRLVWLDSLLQDLRFALRQMRRSPGFAVTAVLTLALGIAANVIVFGVVQAMVLRSLDVPHADRVMTLGSTGMAFPVLAYPEVRDVRDDNTVFSAVAADAVQNFGLDANGVTRPVWGYEVSGQYFEVVGIKPLLGRLLSDDVRLIILGEGDPAYETALAVAARKFPAKFAYQKNYDERLAHLIEAGMDVTLIPSRFEPAGLSAMYSLKYGALPIARAAGGVQEIIEDYDPTTDSGYGFLFYEYSTEAFWDSIKRAREVFRDRMVWTVLMARAMARDFSWDVSARRYEQVYAELVGSDEEVAA